MRCIVWIGRRVAGRRLATRAMAALVVISLVGCGGDDNAPTPLLPAPTGTTAAGTGVATPPATTPVATAPASSPVATGTAAPSPSPPPPATPGATVPPNQPFTSTAAEFGPIVWAAAIDPASFAPTRPIVQVDSLAPAIYAVVPVRRIEAGTTVSAAWSYNDTPIPTASPAVTATERRDGVWLAFDLSRGAVAAWPDGRLGVTILVDGQAVSGAELTIVRAAG